MDKLTVILKTVTPMFLGGADPNEKAELRAPSIKGALRFWYRASKCDFAIEKLHERESRLFGGTDDNSGQSKLLIMHEGHIPSESISKDSLPPHSVSVRDESYKINVLEYLCYGTYDRQKGINVFNRPYIKPETELSFTLKWRGILEESDRKDITNAFQLLHAFGGLGSRSRNGFGGLTVIKNPSKLELNYSDITSLLSPFIKNDIAEYTAFSRETRLFQTKIAFDCWDKALAAIGTAYKQSRENLEKKHSYEKRRYIAAPIVQDVKKFLDRHAKPYFLHVNPVEIDGMTKYKGIILFLPYKYCATNPLIKNQAEVFRSYISTTTEFNATFLKENLEEVKLNA
jgi:CRISPR-associated protein Cmr1